MIIVPKAFALTLCEGLEVDPATGRVSLDGIFNFLRFPAYPTPAQQFTVFSVLHDGLGAGIMSLKILQVGTDRKIYQFQKWAAFSMRLQMVNLEIKVNRCIFPEPGRYLFALDFERQIIAQRYLQLW